MERKLNKKSNILLAISDDQGWPYASAYGCNFLKTECFDRLANEGVLFTNAHCPAPQCSPSRAALLTGMNIWQLEEAGTHASLFPAKFNVYTDILEGLGYHIGYTGKPWAPGNWEDSGRSRNPVGPEYNEYTLTPPASGISDNDYTKNFMNFMSKRNDEQPFCFWFGCKEPHRGYELGSGVASGKNLLQAEVPDFMPDVEDIRSDLLDYAVEIEWFDKHLGNMVKILEDAGELENTIIIVTSDNGMPFPRAKANIYEHGTHIPLAIWWGKNLAGGRVVDDPVSLIDITPTILEAAGAEVPSCMVGKSLMNILTSDKQGYVDKDREYILTGRERHSHARYDNLGYPVRGIRTADYYYVLNLKPDLWPVGEPDGFYDVDNSPSKKYIIENKDKKEIQPFYKLAFDKRPADELYSIKEDPYCINNLAAQEEYKEILQDLKQKLQKALVEQKDPRALGHGNIFDSYPRYNTMREHLGGFALEGQYNTKYKE